MFKAIRYIGSKQKVLNFLEENLFNKLKKNSKFFEGFAGTGIVSQFIAEKDRSIKISGCDISLYSEIMFNILNIGVFKIEETILVNFFTDLNNVKLIKGDIFNEFSNEGVPKSYHESRNFFHSEVGKTIDTYKFLLKQYLNESKINELQSKILLFYLLAYSCKMANTTSVFGAFLKTPAKYKHLDISFIREINEKLETIKDLENPANFYRGDIIGNLKKIDKQNVIYLDPPYSTRRYESNYHILNYIMDLNFSVTEIKVGSKTGLPVKIESNPFGKKKETEEIFKNMILFGVEKSDYLGISYNTDGLIKGSWVEELCQKNGFILEEKKLEYKRFKSNDSENTNKLEEILWIITKNR